MPYQFTTGDIKSIAKRIGLQQVNSKKWNGIDINGKFWQPTSMIMEMGFLF